ncbi:GumC family protein [Qipengyuania sediminis]|uniref:GumC family protein n=1 Tax=Qipengyuania sediminis TaxID=1532023 RepID=UPI001059280C|nr:polysaccharide biosynthesis tyrosine autokinase [Qipengyuania sediminis]
MFNVQTFPAANPAFATAAAPQAGEAVVAGASETPAIERVWLALNKYRIEIAVIIVLALLGALLATLLTTPKYTATSRIEISRQQERVTNVESLTPDTAGQDLEFYQTQYSLLEARSLAERVVRSQRLASDQAFLAAYDLDEASLVSGGARRTAGARGELESTIIDILMRDIDIAPVRNSALVDVSYASPDPAVSRKIADAWVAQFIEATLARRYDSTADARAFLTSRLAELRARLEQSERALVAYAADNNILPIETTVDAEGRTTGMRTQATNNLEALSESLAKASVDRIEAESRLSGPGAKPGGEASAVLPGLRQKRAEIAAEYANLRAQFEDEYPPVQSLKSQVESLDGAIAREERRASTSARQEYTQAVERENDLRGRVQQLERELYGQRSDSIQYNINQREVDTNRELYDGLLQRYKEIGVAGVGSSNISIVDRAAMPEGPSSPNLKLNLALALIAGLGLAFAYAFIREQIDQSVSDPADVSKLLGLSLLGPVPRLYNEEAADALADRKSELSEAYSSIATSLSFLTDHGIPRSMMFTSTVANEGKSTSAYALAEIIGRLGKRVIIVDADMRNPTAHTFYGIPNAHGLSNYLAGGELASSVVQNPSGSNVHVLPAGPTPPSSVELLSSDRMVKVVKELEKSFDHILIDGPPVLGLADAPLLSRVVEGVVLTVEANHIRVRRIKDAVKRIQAAHSHIFGVILTKIDKRNTAYGYGYGYGQNQFEYGTKAVSTAA